MLRADNNINIQMSHFAMQYIKHKTLCKEPTRKNLQSRAGAYSKLAKQFCVKINTIKVWETKFLDFYFARISKLVSSGGKHAAQLAEHTPEDRWLVAVEEKLRYIPKVLLERERGKRRAARSPGDVVRALTALATRRGSLCSTHMYNEVRRALRVHIAVSELHAIWVRAQRVCMRALWAATRGGDRAPRAPPRAAARVADLVLLRTDVHTQRTLTQESAAYCEEARALRALWRAVLRHGAEESADADERARRWTRVWEQYRDSGRIASVVVLQRRWHELKLQARDRIHSYWKDRNKPNPGFLHNTQTQMDVNTTETVANPTEMEANATHMSVNTPQIGSNVTQTRASVIQMGTNETHMGENTTQIDSNVTQMDTSVIQMEENETNMSENTTQIDSNVTQMGTSVIQMGANETNMSENTTQIDSNVTRVGTSVIQMAPSKTHMSVNTTQIGVTQTGASDTQIGTNATQMNELPTTAVKVEVLDGKDMSMVQLAPIHLEMLKEYPHIATAPLVSWAELVEKKLIVTKPLTADEDPDDEDDIDFIDEDDTEKGDRKRKLQDLFVDLEDDVEVPQKISKSDPKPLTNSSDIEKPSTSQIVPSAHTSATVSTRDSDDSDHEHALLIDENNTNSDSEPYTDTTTNDTDTTPKNSIDLHKETNKPDNIENDTNNQPTVKIERRSPKTVCPRIQFEDNYVIESINIAKRNSTSDRSASKPITAPQINAVKTRIIQNTNSLNKAVNKTSPTAHMKCKQSRLKTKCPRLMFEDDPFTEHLDISSISNRTKSSPGSDSVVCNKLTVANVNMCSKQSPSSPDEVLKIFDTHPSQVQAVILFSDSDEDNKPCPQVGKGHITSTSKSRVQDRLMFADSDVTDANTNSTENDSTMNVDGGNSKVAMHSIICNTIDSMLGNRTNMNNLAMQQSEQIELKSIRKTNVDENNRQLSKEPIDDKSLKRDGPTKLSDTKTLASVSSKSKVNSTKSIKTNIVSDHNNASRKNIYTSANIEKGSEKNVKFQDKAMHSNTSRQNKTLRSNTYTHYTGMFGGIVTETETATIGRVPAEIRTTRRNVYIGDNATSGTQVKADRKTLARNIKTNSDKQVTTDKGVDEKSNVSGDIDFKLLLDTQINLIRVDQVPSWKKHNKQTNIDVSKLNAWEITPDINPLFWHIVNIRPGNTGLSNTTNNSDITEQQSAKVNKSQNKRITSTQKTKTVKREWLNQSELTKTNRNVHEVTQNNLDEIEDGVDHDEDLDETLHLSSYNIQPDTSLLTISDDEGKPINIIKILDNINVTTIVQDGQTGAAPLVNIISSDDENEHMTKRVEGDDHFNMRIDIVQDSKGIAEASPDDTNIEDENLKAIQSISELLNETNERFNYIEDSSTSDKMSVTDSEVDTTMIENTNLLKDQQIFNTGTFSSAKVTQHEENSTDSNHRDNIEENLKNYEDSNNIVKSQNLRVRTETLTNVDGKAKMVRTSVRQLDMRRLQRNFLKRNHVKKPKPRKTKPTVSKAYQALTVTELCDSSGDSSAEREKKRQRVTKRVELPDIEEVRRLNRNILTAQVAPISSQSTYTEESSSSMPAEVALSEDGGDVPTVEEVNDLVTELASTAGAQPVCACAASSGQPHSRDPPACACCPGPAAGRSLRLEFRALHDDIEHALGPARKFGDTARLTVNKPKPKTKPRKRTPKRTTEEMPRSEIETESDANATVPQPVNDLEEWNRQKNINNQYFMVNLNKKQQNKRTPVNSQRPQFSELPSGAKLTNKKRNKTANASKTKARATAPKERKPTLVDKIEALKNAISATDTNSDSTTHQIKVPIRYKERIAALQPSANVTRPKQLPTKLPPPENPITSKIIRILAISKNELEASFPHIKSKDIIPPSLVTELVGKTPELLTVVNRTKPNPSKITSEKTKSQNANSTKTNQKVEAIINLDSDEDDDIDKTLTIDETVHIHADGTDAANKHTGTPSTLPPSEQSRDNSTPAQQVVMEAPQKKVSNDNISKKIVISKVNKADSSKKTSVKKTKTAATNSASKTKTRQIIQVKDSRSLLQRNISEIPKINKNNESTNIKQSEASIHRTQCGKGIPIDTFKVTTTTEKQDPESNSNKPEVKTDDTKKRTWHVPIDNDNENNAAHELWMKERHSTTDFFNTHTKFKPRDKNRKKPIKLVIDPKPNFFKITNSEIKENEKIKICNSPTHNSDSNTESDSATEFSPCISNVMSLANFTNENPPQTEVNLTQIINTSQPNLQLAQTPNFVSSSNLALSTQNPLYIPFLNTTQNGLNIPLQNTLLQPTFVPMSESIQSPLPQVSQNYIPIQNTIVQVNSSFSQIQNTVAVSNQIQAQPNSNAGQFHSANFNQITQTNQMSSQIILNADLSMPLIQYAGGFIPLSSLAPQLSPNGLQYFTINPNACPTTNVQVTAEGTSTAGGTFNVGGTATAGGTGTEGNSQSVSNEGEEMSFRTVNIDDVADDIATGEKAWLSSKVRLYNYRPLAPTRALHKVPPGACVLRVDGASSPGWLAPYMVLTSLDLACEVPTYFTITHKGASQRIVLTGFNAEGPNQSRRQKVPDDIKTYQYRVLTAVGSAAVCRSLAAGGAPLLLLSPAGGLAPLRVSHSGGKMLLHSEVPREMLDNLVEQMNALQDPTKYKMPKKFSVTRLND